MVPAGDLRHRPRVELQPQDSALADVSGEPLQTRPGGPQRASDARRVAHLRQRGRPGEERHQHEVAAPGGRPLRHLQRPRGQLRGRGRGRHHPAGAGAACFLLPVSPLQAVGQEGDEDSEGLRGVSAQHQGGGVHGQVRGEELRHKALHREERQHQPQPGDKRQSEAGQPGGQNPQQPRRRHRGLKHSLRFR